LPRNITAEALQNFRIPTLFVTAQKDVILPPDIVHMAAALVPGCDVIDLGDAGHSSYFEIPERFNDVVRTFLINAENAS
jgi:pimeloyl-ACP methyl ester carboxylesterase